MYVIIITNVLAEKQKKFKKNIIQSLINALSSNKLDDKFKYQQVLEVITQVLIDEQIFIKRSKDIVVSVVLSFNVL